MRVAEVTATFPPYFGGMGNACLRFAAGLVEQGHDVAVYTSRYPDEPYLYPDGLVVHRLRHQFRYGNAPLLLGLFNISDTDVIHLHYPFYFGAEIVFLVSKLRRIPYVVTYQMDMVGEGFLKTVFSLHKKLLLKTLMSGAERIYVGSTDYAQNSFLASIPAIQDRVVAIPMGVDIERFRPAPKDPEILRRHGLSAAEQVILFVGQLDRPHYFKGVPVLLEAFSKLARPRVKLVLVGDGDLRPSFESLARTLGISDSVIFAGRVEDDELSRYFSIADFSVLPSIDKSEAYGLVLLEAQASGRGVIASNLPGVRSLVDVGVDGFVVQPGDPLDLRAKMETLLDDEGLTSTFGANGRRKVEDRYSWGRVCEALSRDLERVKASVAGRRSGGRQPV